MMVPAAFVCFHSCERHKSRSYCVTAVNTAYVACAETEEAKTSLLVVLQAKEFCILPHCPPGGKTVIRMKTQLKRLYCLSVSFSDMYSMFQTYQTGR